MRHRHNKHCYRKALQLEFAASRPRKDLRVPRGIRVRLLKRTHNMKVFIVDGEKIRRDVYTDFTMGGNPAVYSFVPHDEIWLDQNLSAGDREATLLHEIVEYRLMMNEKLSYEKAHDKATIVERKLRRA